MSIIYEPSGKAREYSELAANLYNGCNHGCKYCYAPGIRRKVREDYLSPEPRRNIIRDFEIDCKKNYNTPKPVLFCFMTDPYNSKESELRLTREALKIALRYKIPIKILTKSKAVLNDIDVIKKFGKSISVGMTLTFDNEKDSSEWEPKGALPKERIEVLKTLKKQRVPTWASFEPVVIPDQSLSMIEKSLPFTDVYKIGKLNNYKGLDKKINWEKFLVKAVAKIRGEKPFYVKKDLREAAPNVKLYGNEVLMDDFNPEAF